VSHTRRRLYTETWLRCGCCLVDRLSWRRDVTARCRCAQLSV